MLEFNFKKALLKIEKIGYLETMNIIDDSNTLMARIGKFIQNYFKFVSESQKTQPFNVLKKKK